MYEPYMGESPRVSNGCGAGMNGCWNGSQTIDNQVYGQTVVVASGKVSHM